MANGKMEVSKSVFAALIGCLVLALIGSAFLLGRESTRTPAVALVTPTPAQLTLVANPEPSSLSTESSESTRLTRAERPRIQRQTVVASQPSEEVAVTRQNSPVAAPIVVEKAPEPRYPVATSVAKAPSVKKDPPVAARPTAPPEVRQDAPHPAPTQSSPASKDAIRKYLAEVDKISTGTTSLHDPQGFATQLLQQSLGGDSSGFDQLLQDGQNTLSKLRSIRPPEACQEHHRLSVGQLTAALSLLAEVKSATVSMDTSALSALSQQGRGLESDTARLRELDQQLRTIANAP